MKSNIFLAIGISLVVLLGALSAFESKYAPNLQPTSPQTEMSAEVAEN